MTVITAAGGDQTATLNSAISTANSAGQQLDLHGTFDIQTGDSLTYVQDVEMLGFPKFTGGDLTTDEVLLTIPDISSGHIAGVFDGEKTKDLAVAIGIKAGTVTPEVGFRDARVDVNVFGWKTGIDWVGWSCRQFIARISACDVGLNMSTGNGMPAFLHILQNNRAGVITVSNCLTLYNPVIEGNVAGLEINGGVGGGGGRSLVVNNPYFESNYSTGTTPSTGADAAMYINEINGHVYWLGGQIGGSEVFIEDCPFFHILGEPTMLSGGSMKVKNSTVYFGAGVNINGELLPTKKSYGNSITTLYEF